jgi:hypothetical protein
MVGGSGGSIGSSGSELAKSVYDLSPVPTCQTPPDLPAYFTDTVQDTDAFSGG